MPIRDYSQFLTTKIQKLHFLNLIEQEKILRGKFTVPDPLIQNVYDPQSLNRYAFEQNNPYKYTDPDGHLPQALVAIGIYVATVTTFSIAAGVIWAPVGAITGGLTETTKALDSLSREGIGFKEAITSSEIRKALLKEIGRGIGGGLVSGFKEGFLKGLETITPLEGLSQAYSASSMNKDYSLPSQINIPSYNVNGVNVQTTHKSGGGSSGYLSGSSGNKVKYTITEKNGKTTGGSIGNIQMSSGFAKLFKKYVAKK